MRHTQQVMYNGRSVELAMGYDTAVGGYFMTVAPLDHDSDNPDADPETGMIYSNLDEKSIPFPGMTPDITLYKQRLREMNIDVPVEFFGKVLAD